MKYTKKDFPKPLPAKGSAFVGVRLPIASRDKLAESAAKLGIRVSTLVRRCLKDAGVI